MVRAFKHVRGLLQDNVGKAFVAYPNETCVHFTCKDDDRTLHLARPDDLRRDADFVRRNKSSACQSCHLKVGRLEGLLYILYLYIILGLFVICTWVRFADSVG